MYLMINVITYSYNYILLIVISFIYNFVAEQIYYRWYCVNLIVLYIHLAALLLSTCIYYKKESIDINVIYCQHAVHIAGDVGQDLVQLHVLKVADNRLGEHEAELNNFITSAPA